MAKGPYGSRRCCPHRGCCPERAQTICPLRPLRFAVAAFAPCLGRVWAAFGARLRRVVPYCGGACAPVVRGIHVARAMWITGLRNSALAHAGFLRPIDVAYGHCAIGEALHCFYRAARRNVGYTAYSSAAWGSRQTIPHPSAHSLACGMYRVAQVFLLQPFMTVCLDKADCARHGAGTRLANFGFRPHLVKPLAHKAFTSKISA